MLVRLQYLNSANTRLVPHERSDRVPSDASFIPQARMCFMPEGELTPPRLCQRPSIPNPSQLLNLSVPDWFTSIRSNKRPNSSHVGLQSEQAVQSKSPFHLPCRFSRHLPSDCSSTRASRRQIAVGWGLCSRTGKHGSPSCRHAFETYLHSPTATLMDSMYVEVKETISSRWFWCCRVISVYFQISL